MAQIIHNISTPNDGAGDKLRVAFDHQNQMNTELYTNKVDKLDGFGLSENNLTDALVATIESLSTNVPTLQEVLDFNHDLINGNNFQGTNAGQSQIGINNNGFGNGAGFSNTGTNVNGLGEDSANTNSGDNVNGIGNSSLVSNSGNNVNAFGYYAGGSNTYSNINLFGNSAQADSDNQTVFSKEGTAMARISYNDITANRKYELPDKSGTFALLDDTSKSEYKTANFTAENGYFYVVGSNNTVITDSTPIIGSGYIAFSLRGSSIIGGVTYLDLSLVYRFYTSVGWQSKDMSNQQEFIELNTLINAKLTKTGDTITGNFENTSTGFFQVAQGTTAQRPSSPSNGMIRYNSTTQRTEFYSNGAWRNPARLEGDTFTGNVFAPNLSRIAVKDAVAGSNITGVTTEVLCGTYPIPANTFNANDIMRISSFLAEKTGTAGTCTMRVKVGSSASFGSATTIATYTISGTNLSATMLRNSITLRGGNIRTISPTTSNITDIIVTNVGFSNIAFNPAIDNYIFTSLQLSVGTDSVFQSNLLMTN